MNWGVWSEQTQSWETGQLPTRAQAFDEARKLGGERCGMYACGWGGEFRPIDPPHVAREEARLAKETKRLAERAALLGSFAKPTIKKEGSCS